jgi:glycosyltransferase involved in cell wall biosynthesis
MRVLIDTTYAGRGHSGTGVYLDRIVPALRDAGVDVVTVANEDRRRPAGGGLGSLRNLRDDRRWAARDLPRLVREHGADVLHHPLPDRSRDAGVAQVVTVHDVAVATLPEAFALPFRVYARAVQRPAARAADAVVAPSQTTAAEAVRAWGLDEQAIVVALHGPGQELPDVERAAEPSHVLYLGDDEPRKNVELLRAAHARWHREHPETALPLVLAGSGHAAGPNILVDESPAPLRVAELHANALALVHPARHEGFGLTVLEAMAAGTPVIAASSPAIEEVLGPDGFTVGPDDVAMLAAVMAELQANPGLRADFSARAKTRALAFTWAAAAQAHVEAYTLALARHDAAAQGFKP